MPRSADILSSEEAALKSVTADLLDDASVPDGVVTGDVEASSGVLNTSVASDLKRSDSVLSDSALKRLTGVDNKTLRNMSPQLRKKLEAQAQAIESMDEGDLQKQVRASNLKKLIARGAQGLAFLNAAGSATGKSKDVEADVQSQASRQIASRIMPGKKKANASKKAAQRKLQKQIRRERVKAAVRRRGAQRVAQRASTQAAQASRVATSSGVRAVASVVTTPAKGMVASSVAAVFAGILVAILLLSAVLGVFVGSVYERTSVNLDMLSASERQVASYLFAKGLDDVHVAAIMANMRAESGGSPGDDFNTGSVELITGAGHGLCQWTGSRWLNLLNYSIEQGLPWTDLGLQLDFFWSEYEGFSDSYTRTYTVNSTSTDPEYPTVVSGSKAGFIEATDVATATKEFCYFFEGPGVPHESVRITYAETYLSWFRSSGFADGWVFPLPDGSWTLTSDFGERDGEAHNGVDFAATTGTAIYAACAGEVIYAGWYGTGGYTVIIDHGDGITSRYLHMSEITASVGDYVDAGDVIGYVGSTGNSTGPHLHFEIRVDGTAVNPSGYIAY